MSIFALIFALLLEQFRPISSRNLIYLSFIRFANYLARYFNSGQLRHGIIAWLVAVLPPVILCIIIFWVLRDIHSVLGWLWCVGMLYLNMGFRQFSHAFTKVANALQEGNVQTAQATLGNWTEQDASDMSSEEISRIAIEQGTVDAYRYVFGPIFWFIVLAPWFGPAGTMFYRLSSLLCQQWKEDSTFAAFGRCAAKVQYILDWIPIRITAISLALMGDFEDAIYCWRMQARHWNDRIFGILLASVGGALGVCLGSAVTQDHIVKIRPELGLGEAADPNLLRSAVGLIWRTVLLWISVIFLFSLVGMLAHSISIG